MEMAALRPMGRMRTTTGPLRSTRTRLPADRRALRRRALAGFVATLTIALVACGTASLPTPRPTAAVLLAAVPAPPDATVTVGADAPGLDGGTAFLAYVSSSTPQTAARTYDATLRAAGFTAAGRQAEWAAYARADVALWVSVSSDGPPTTIVIRLADEHDPITAAAGRTATPDPDASREPGSRPATPEPATRPGGPFATPAGPSPDRTQKPKPTQKPKATQKPKGDR